MSPVKSNLLKAYQVALMKESFFDSHMPGLRTPRTRGLHAITFHVLKCLTSEGKLTSLPVSLGMEALKVALYPPSGRRRLDDSILPALQEALISEHIETQVHGILSDAVELYGLYAGITVRLRLLSDRARSTTQSQALLKLRTSREEDILATLMLGKLSSGDVNVNIYHRLRAFRRSMQSLEDILTLANKTERAEKQKNDLQRLSAGRLPSQGRF